MKYSIKLGLHKKTAKGKEPIELHVRLRVSWNSLRADLNTGYIVDPLKWDATNCIVKSNTKNSNGQSASEINRGLSRLCGIAEDTLTLFELQNKRPPTAAEFKEAYGLAIGKKQKEKPTPDTDFYTCYDKFTASQSREKNWTDATIEKFHALREHLKEWRPKIELNDFTKDDFSDFIFGYLIGKLSMLNPTVSKIIGYIRWFLRWAAANGYYKGLAHEQFRPRLPGLDCKEVIYLEWEELMHFLTFKFPPKYTSFPPCRDVFCFCCFTGLRYSDVAKLRRSDIHHEVAPSYIDVVTKKTYDRLHIELNKYATAILDKYKNVRFKGDKALPVTANATMNENLHLAAKAAGINELIRIVQFSGHNRIETVVPKYSVLTTHAGRRTFIVNGLRLGIPAPVIMEWTGHSDYKAMKPYIKIVDAAKVENMDKFNTFSPDDESEKGKGK